MECIFCEKKTCLANRNYQFLRGNQQIKVIKCGSSKDMHTKYTVFPWKQDWASKLYPHPKLCNRIIHSLAPDKSGRYTGFWYVDGKMINQLDACNLEEDKVFHIHMELIDENTKPFIKNHQIFPFPCGRYRIQKK